MKSDGFGRNVFKFEKFSARLNPFFRDDHRQKQPENFNLKRNGSFSSFLFATFLVAFIALEGIGSRAVQIHSQNFIICIRIYRFPRRFQFY